MASTTQRESSLNYIEKTIRLENISLVDFLGAGNSNINTLSQSFPQSKIISRGNEIYLKGSPTEIVKINDIVLSLLEHFEKYGELTNENVKSYLNNDESFISPQTPEGIVLYGNRGVVVKAKTPNQQQLIDVSRRNDIVFAIGPAGTGKTYVSVSLAIKALKNKEVKKIIITRPAVEAGENLGFLPGDLQEKIDPYLRPIYDALSDIVPAEKLKYFQENRIIEIAPLAYMRGRTLNEAFILLDEAQNTTPMQLKMFLTRMGPKSKMIITGDTSQIDLPNHQKSGLVDAISKLSGIDGIGFVYLNETDVVRHPLVRKIISAYAPPKSDEK